MHFRSTVVPALALALAIAALTAPAPPIGEAVSASAKGSKESTRTTTFRPRTIGGGVR